MFFSFHNPKKANNPKSILAFLMLLTLMKGVITSFLVPPFEFPDEQAHFAQVSHFVEAGTNFGQLDLSKEIFLLETTLGTDRDQRGNNSYTYNSSFKPQYSNSTYGPREKSIRSLSLEDRSTFVKLEAARYKSIFYHLSTIGYRLGYHLSIFERIFFTRFISVVLFTITVFLSYLIGLEISKNQSLALVLASIVSFQPMHSFVGSGINNDNLANLIGTLIILSVFWLYHRGLSWQWSLFAGILIGSGFFTKPLVIPVAASLPVFILHEWKRSKRSLKKQCIRLVPLIFGAFFFGGFLFIRPLLTHGYILYFPRFAHGSTNVSLLHYLKSQIPRYYRETFVWYWGIFKWLGVILPINLIRIIKIIISIGFVGLIRVFRNHKLRSVYARSVLILATFSLVYIFSLTYWDYRMINSIGFSHGLQGRYFFPTISAHMGLLVIGWIAIFPQKIRHFAGFYLSGFFILAHSLSLFTIAHSYYDLTTWKSFLIQSSQYKPIFVKYPLNIIWFCFYLFVLIIFIKNSYRYIILSAPKKESL